MNVIHKFQFPEEEFTLKCSLPADAKVIHVAAQGNLVTLWIQYEEDAPRIVRNFRIFGIGERFHDVGHYRHVGTALIGVYVWHVFEVKTR